MGGANLFPGLGFDPAPGDLGAVTGVGSALTQAQTQLAEAYATVSRMTGPNSVWEGKAADAFAARIYQLPKHLDTAQQAFGDAARELETWQTQLIGMKAQAQEYEAEAVPARARYEQAARNPDLGLLNATFDSLGLLGEAQRRYDAAVAELNAAQGELEGIIDQAKRLLAQHRELAETAAKVLNAAADMAPPGPGFFASILDGLEAFVQANVQAVEEIGAWVQAHANAINAAGDMLAAGSTVLGLVGSALDLAGVPEAGVAFNVMSGVVGLGALAAHSVALAAGAPVSGETLIEDGLSAVSFGISSDVRAADVLSEAAPKVIGAIAKGGDMGDTLGALSTVLSVNDFMHDPSALEYFEPKSGSEWGALGVGAAIPGGPALGLLAVGFENAWAAGSAKDHAAAVAGAS